MSRPRPASPRFLSFAITAHDDAIRYPRCDAAD
jgi:hypothetical protein